ncbi:MAG: pilus assembly protein [Neptuniibacter sp.]
MYTRYTVKLLHVLFTAVYVLCALPAHSTTVAQTPLFLGQGNVPGNLALVPSVEWPTVVSVANIASSYDETVESVGYFDSNKCYTYQYSATESDRHFYPVSVSAGYTCPGDVWSGNFLNWAATQTIDPFRSALTGGYRVKDTTTETWLEKARHSGQGGTGIYPNRALAGGSTIVNNATPFSTSSLTIQIQGRGNEMRIVLPSGHGFSNSTGGTINLVFADGDFSSGWNNYSSGAVARSSTQDWDGSGFSLKKINNNDPHGGYKDIGSTQDFDNFIYEVWIYRPTVGTQSGQSDRLALSNSSASGYGIKIDAGSIAIERRNSGSASGMVSTSWTRPTDEWFRIVFESVSGDKFKITAYNSSGTQLATVTSGSDTNYSNFSRIYVHGGHEYFVDAMKLWTSSGATLAYEPISTDEYDATVRVKVCDSNVGVETNCKQYGSNWKPEGLIQRYSDSIRYSIFGYLNDHNILRDGGVLRAEQKFVGPTQLIPGSGESANPNKEWDETTGIFVQDPDDALADATGTYYFGNSSEIVNSGVINYLNKFGQLNSNNFKSKDPVSELYYTALRYFKQQNNISEYYTKTPTHDSSPSTTTKRQWVDNFPVVTSANWNGSDPIQYACQKNVILGIGDVYTHRDKNLPSTSSTSGTDEPTKPSLVASDTSVDVRIATQKIADLEGFTINTGASSWTGRNNSAYMVGLAYDANTKDIRPNSGDYVGDQTVQTYWVDVLENQTLEPIAENQYWLIAKYGGFQVRKHPSCTDPSYTPTGTECDDQSLGDPYARTAALPEWWWYTNTDMLDPNAGPDIKRTDNYYTAGEAKKMVEGLTQAFTDILESVRGSGTSLATSSPRLNSNSAVYSALLDTTYWSGDVVARSISSGAVVSGTELWSAADILDAIPEANLGNRKIYTSTYAAKNTTTGVTLNTGGVEFKWTSLSAEQKESLRKTPASGPLVIETIAEQRLDFLRGSRLLEISASDISQPFRRRDSRLGDIVNSSPLYVDQVNYGFTKLSDSPFSSSIASAYSAYRSTTGYLNKPDTILVGSNDGMLHLIDATTGSDGGRILFSYVPSGVFDELYQLVYSDYEHRFYVDGPSEILDAWFDPSDVPTGVTSGWKTVAATTLGSGGQGVSLIDISDPENMDASSVLWEFRHEDMGYLIQKPSITALPNGKFGVVVTSGFSSGATDAHIWILNVADGSIIKDFVVPNAGGLGEAFITDLNRDGITERIYVGDTNGNLWRFDLDSALPANWDAPTHLLSGTDPQPFFIAKDASNVRQPITAPLTADYDSKGRLIILFGTGSYYLTGDNEVDSSSQVQTMYGVLDQNAVVTGRSQLLKQEVLNEQTVSGNLIRATTNRVLELNDKGWYMDLQWAVARSGPGPKGELVKEAPILRVGLVLFQGFTPSDDPCSPGGTNNIMALDPSTGGRLSFNPFDIDGDGAFGDGDMVTITYEDDDGNIVTEDVVATGVVFDSATGGIANIGEDSIVVTTSGETKVLGTDDQSAGITVKGLQENIDEGRQGWREVR